MIATFHSALWRRLCTLVLASLVIPATLWAQEEEPAAEVSALDGLNNTINAVIGPVTSFAENIIFAPIPIMGQEVPFVLIWLFIAAIVVTIYFKFVNFTAFGLALKTVRGKYDEKGAEGEVSHFQALTTAVSATVGLGNIAGVAVAISVGGPGAMFWMVVVGLLGMSSKFAECTLGVKFRQIDATGKVYGGPMYYLRDGLAEKGFGMLGKILAVIFAVMCIGGSFGGGNMFQVNQAAQAVSDSMPTFSPVGVKLTFGIITAALVALVIIGGIRSIARVTSLLVPFMCGGYVIVALLIIIMNIGEVPGALGTIFREAFSPAAGVGGILGVMIQGIKRAAFSNEAGIGSAPIAHSAVKTKHPASEGVVALLEPFIDTVVVCSMTALVIVITGTYQMEDASGITVTSEAFETSFKGSRHLLSLAVILFAFSTMISWSYYGQQAWSYLLGRDRTTEIAYKVLFCLMVVVGAALPMEKVIGFSDAMIFAMAVPNIIGLYFLLPVIKRELIAYRAHAKDVDSRS